MNERIKQLVGQTLDEKFSGTWSVMDMQDLTKFADRFAELIVRECIQVGGPEDSYTDEWFKAKVDSVQKIKEHFGVE
jgi:hypothetical protein